jgi:hypothetical protein
MLVHKCIHKLRDILKIANHIKNNHEKNKISPSKDVKNTTYSRNEYSLHHEIIFSYIIIGCSPPRIVNNKVCE